MIKFQRKPSLFKNDIFGFKERRFRRKLYSHLKKDIKLKIKLIEHCLDVAINIGMPKNNDDTELLAKIIKTFDNTMGELDAKIKYSRIYIEADDQESSEIATKSET